MGLIRVLIGGNDLDRGGYGGSWRYLCQGTFWAIIALMVLGQLVPYDPHVLDLRELLELLEHLYSRESQDSHCSPGLHQPQEMDYRTYLSSKNKSSPSGYEVREVERGISGVWRAWRVVEGKVGLKVDRSADPWRVR